MHPCSCAFVWGVADLSSFVRRVCPQPDLVMRNIIPVVMAGVLGIYGLIVAVVLIQAGMSRVYRMVLVGMPGPEKFIFLFRFVLHPPSTCSQVPVLGL